MVDSHDATKLEDEKGRRSMLCQNLRGIKCRGRDSLWSSGNVAGIL